MNNNNVELENSSEVGLYTFVIRFTYDNGMIYETATITNLHGYCFKFSPNILGTTEGTFITPL